MPVADPLKKQIAQKARLHMKICISCGARLDISATRCRKCRSTSLRLKNRQLGIKTVSYTHLTLPTILLV